MTPREGDDAAGTPVWDPEPIPTLQRWETSGGTWRVLGRSAGVTRVGLFSCDAGELMGVMCCADDGISAFLAGRAGSDD
jgi:hypothetical protein